MGVWRAMRITLGFRAASWDPHGRREAVRSSSSRAPSWGPAEPTPNTRFPPVSALLSSTRSEAHLMSPFTISTLTSQHPVLSPTLLVHLCHSDHHRTSSVTKICPVPSLPRTRLKAPKGPRTWAVWFPDVPQMPGAAPGTCRRLTEVC